MELNENGLPLDPDLTFEDFKNENGITYWWASDLALMLGYKDLRSFQKVLDKATKAFISIGISHHDNIFPAEREMGDDFQKDFKLTRFACYLTVMNGDPNKLEVAYAQAYFAEKTRLFELQSQAADEIDRLVIRDEIKDGTKALNAVALRAGLQDFARFTNAGYLGMYNMISIELELKRSVKHGTLFDHMGRTELAANLFRVTQTEERIKNLRITGQRQLEETHKDVGKEVRKIVIQNTGKAPENLPQAKKLNEIKKDLKDGHRKMIKADSKKKT